MEKESAEKATTELDNSVTSEEQSSLAENTGKKATENHAESPQDQPDEETKATEKTEAPAKVKVDTEDTKALVEEPSSSDSDQQVAEPKQDNDSEDIPTEAKVEDNPSPDKPSVEVQSEIDNNKDKEIKSSAKAEDKSSPDKPLEKEQSKIDSNKDKEVTSSAKVEEESTEEEADSDEDDDDHDVNDELSDADFAKMSRKELVEIVKKIGKYENPFHADKILQKMAPVFNELRDKQKEKALKKFTADGSSPDDFQYKPDELELRFDANYQLIKDKKAKRFKEQDLERTKNLVLAEDILNELRDFMDSEESNASFNDFKTIQQKWKDLGSVPAQNSRTLWANYNALIHRFYDQRSIYFELKELDRKKNYEAKLELCEKAEALVDVKNLREAIRGLNDLHHEFKHLGPVPQEVQEELWQRFKDASDKIYERRKAFVNELKTELHENQVKKEELIEKLKTYTEFSSDRIKEWNAKTKEVVAIQKEWEAIGGLPKDRAKEINKEFWGAFKQFFGNKHKFFKKLDAEREDNLAKKQELLAKAIELKDSEEWDKSGNELKLLQQQWRDIGPVPEKMRKRLYDEFKEACDYFFENRRKGMKSSQDQYKDNLKEKKAIIVEIESLVPNADKNLDKFNELRARFTEIGYVPKKNIGSIKDEFQLVVEKFLNSLTVLNVKEKTEISLEAEFSNLASSSHSETELYHKEQSVRRQINKFEDDIALWQNNLEFFAHSKSTEKLRKEVNAKIEDARLQVDSLKRQLKMLRSL